MPTHTLMVFGNHRPKLRGINEAMKSRIHLIPFGVTIPPEKRDPQLPEKLKSEWSGILSWMIEGAVEWRASGLKPPPVVVEATEEYFNNSDTLGKWLEDCCKVVEYAKAPIGDLYESWDKWRAENGEYEISKQRFGDVLEERGFKREKGGAGVRLHAGLSLNQDNANH